MTAFMDDDEDCERPWGEEIAEINFTAILERRGIYGDTDTPYLFIEIDSGVPDEGPARISDEGLFYTPLVGDLSVIREQFRKWLLGKIFYSVCLEYIWVQKLEHFPPCSCAMSVPVSIDFAMSLFDSSFEDPHMQNFKGYKGLILPAQGDHLGDSLQL